MTTTVIDREVTIGRDVSCTIRIQAAAVSRVHCRIVPSIEYVILTDESRNGTFVNGTIVGQGKIANVRRGDSIEVDAESFRIERVETAAQQKVTQNLLRVRPASSPSSPPAAPTVVPPAPVADVDDDIDFNSATTEVHAARVRPPRPKPE